MGRLCERPGCSRPAAARYLIDVGRLLVSIAAIADDQPGGVLCRAHAAAMTPPRGWTMDDRRIDAPPLFHDEPVALPARRPRPPRRAVAAVVVGEVVEQLSLDDPVVEPLVVTEQPPTLDETQALPWVPRFEGADPDVLVAATSPLLARAFRVQPRLD